MSKVLIDDRFRGTHGIGRYASEVLPRLAVPWKALDLDGKAASPLDVLRSRGRPRSGETFYSPGYAGFVARGRQLLTLHDLIHLTVSWPQRAKYSAYYNAVLRPVIRRAGIVFTVSQTSEQAIREWLADDSIEIVNTGNACSTAFTEVGPSTPNAGGYLLYVGNMRSHKNAHIGLSILRRLPDARLHILIPASEHHEMTVLAESAGVLGRVEFLPSLSDEELACEYRGAAATLMPSSVEGFGLPALESVCCGTPVLYWAGCAAVGEAALGFGCAVADLSNEDEWAHLAGTMLQSRERVQVISAPAWDQVARRVDVVLQAELAGI